MSGGGAGTGVGSLLGTLAGVALAPETGGLSLAIPAAMGAAGSELGNLATGNKQSPLMAALMGGVSGGLGGASGFGGDLGIANAGGVGDSISGVLPSWLGGTAKAAGDVAGSISPMADILPSLGGESMAPSVLPSTSGASGIGSGLMNYLGKQNPLNLALAGGTALSGIQSLMPHKQVNIGQNAANVMATNPGFNDPNLPKYTMQNTASPYQGNWYTYGQTPQTPLYNAMPTPAKHGGLMHYAHGGQVKGYAMGGQPMPAQGAPMPSQGMPQQSVNPLALKAVHEVGVAIGEHIKKKRTPLGQVHGAGGGQDDAIPAKLSDGEYIVPSETVAQLGDGSSTAGGKKLDQMVHNIRTHKTSKGGKFPPKARNPLSYVGGAS